MKELVFVVQQDMESGGYTACAPGESFFTQAHDLDALRDDIRHTIQNRYPRAEERPRISFEIF